MSKISILMPTELTSTSHVLVTSLLLKMALLIFLYTSTIVLCLIFTLFEPYSEFEQSKPQLTFKYIHSLDFWFPCTDEFLHVSALAKYLVNEMIVLNTQTSYDLLKI